MASAKQILMYGLELQAEPTYRGAVTFTPATDGVLLVEPAVLTWDYVNDGMRALSNASAAALTRNTPSGRFGGLPFRVEGRGQNTTYAAGVFPQDLHVALRGCGLSATFSATPTPQWTYAPESDTYESVAARLFSRGQQHDLTGAYLDYSVGIDGPDEAVFDFDIQGLLALPSDAALPAITYANHKPPIARNVALVVNAFTTLVARSIRFTNNRTRTQRMNINESVTPNALAGYGPGRRMPTLDLVVEATALASFNPYTLRDNATEFALEFTVGSVQYNRFKFSAPQAQVVSVSEDADDPVALWNLQIALPASAQTANNEYSWLFN